MLVSGFHTQRSCICVGEACMNLESRNLKSLYVSSVGLAMQFITVLVNLDRAKDLEGGREIAESPLIPGSSFIASGIHEFTTI